LREEIMAADDEIQANPEVSQDFKYFEEFCSENTGQELAYLEMVGANPLEMDPVTLAFSMRHLLRLSTPLMKILLTSLSDDLPPNLETVLSLKGIDLDKTQASRLRDIIFSFRDCGDQETSCKLVRALQLMTISRMRRKVVLNLGEPYAPPEEGWTLEDFGGDEWMLDTVRSVEDPRSTKSEET
jgi:hypothetical protein